ncbi:MAG: carbon-nitrogen hydrolase family protein [Candidatus Heimdallarchaeota archaeon]|nr:carbon-nitrogen hydrolase family protein [Candidatus Heimdallarchaeota archaeon]
MIDKEKFVNVAVVQDSSVIMRKNECIKKINTLSKDAASKGAKIVLFPEAFIPAYPRGLFFGTKIGNRSEKGKQDFARYWENAITIPGTDIDLLCEIAKTNKVYLIIGVIERDSEYSGGTLYCTILYFDPSGKLIGKHRKLKPTGSERLIWGEGDGSTLTVIESPYGKIGGLICWENYMPLARTAIYSKGVEIYVAPTADAREQWQATLKHIALEGRCFVLASNQFVTKDMYPKDLACYEELESSPEIMCRGGSAIIDPNGNYIAEPLFDKSGILYAELDLSLIQKSRFDFDVVGHYSRPDIFQLIVNEKKQEIFKEKKKDVGK